MVHTPIDHQVGLPARDLAIQNTGDVDTRFADEVAAEFDDRRRLGQSL